MCEHLSPLEKELHSRNIKETFRGEAWSVNCREWIYYDCYLNCKSIINRLHLPAFVAHSINNDPRSGLEEGLFCEQCKDAILGYHRTLDGGRNVPTIN